MSLKWIKRSWHQVWAFSNDNFLLSGQADAPATEDPDHPANPFGIEAAKAKLKKIRLLRSEIDKLRTFVSDKYAEEVGNNCITQ